MDGWQEREQTFELSKENGYLWTGRGIEEKEEKEESIVLLLTVKALK